MSTTWTWQVNNNWAYCDRVLDLLVDDADLARTYRAYAGLKHMSTQQLTFAGAEIEEQIMRNKQPVRHEGRSASWRRCSGRFTPVVLAGKTAHQSATKVRKHAGQQEPAVDRCPVRRACCRLGSRALVVRCRGSSTGLECLRSSKYLKSAVAQTVGCIRRSAFAQLRRRSVAAREMVSERAAAAARAWKY